MKILIKNKKEEKRKLLIDFDEISADILNYTEFEVIVMELVILGRKQIISLVFTIQCLDF